MSGPRPQSGASGAEPATVSVVIPCHNSAGTVEGTLRSLERQTVPPLEVILVDDGSTDGTAEVLARWEREPAVRVLRQPNRGVSAARNAGVRAACGRWVAMLDSDDEFTGDAIEAMRGALDQAPGARWCITDVIRVRPDRSEHMKSTPPEVESANWLPGLLERNFIERAVIFEREACLEVGGFDERLRAYEDWEFEIRLVRAAVPAVHLQRPVYRYVENSFGVTRNIPLMLQELEKVLRRHHLELARGGDPLYRRIYANRMWMLGREHLHRRRDLPRALRCAYECLCYDPEPVRRVRAFVSGLARRPG
jgi:glycosyltransferase involved in cell wall biosynthesis